MIEIGPGHGELTKHILKKKPRRLIIIEKDGKLAAELSKKLRNDNLRIIHGDALKLLPEAISEEKLPGVGYKIAGNIPYYITGYLLRIISGLERKPSLTALVIQREVAERITARPPEMNLLAASVQFWAEPEILEKISAKKFKPAPKVDSALLLLATTENAEKIAAEKYYPFIKKLFKQPRKTILNNLSEGLPIEEKKRAQEKLAILKIDSVSRPQTLDVDKIKELASVFH